MDRWNFYKETVQKYLPKKNKILVVSGSYHEAQILEELGYKNLYFSYFDKDDKKDLLKNKPILKNKIIYLDTSKEKAFKKIFDYVFVHAVIHHLNKPHSGILNLFSIAKKGLLIIESNDSLVMRIAAKIKFVETFELSAIRQGKGGVQNTAIPNYIYRWTEREILKLIRSFRPNKIYPIKFDYSFDLNNEGTKKHSTILKRIVRKILEIPLAIFLTIFKKQGNGLSIFINKKNYKNRFK
tara:strand:+ start:98 stop:814 length:717 start_codon:yes stop_codon:yes gene_type:complete